ncbi:MAG: phosphoenolpyruvate--protein phosphotransferase [Planctomycetia bacterium]|nr:phosphoenolpyruvate--protein phosphotransferase [Planctomycetia bacterium]
MITFQGIAVSPGVAIGKAVVFNVEGGRVPPSYCESTAVPAELERLDDAIRLATVGIQESSQGVSQKIGVEYGAIFEGHLLMLHDDSLKKRLREAVEKRRFSAEYAVYDTLGEYAAKFQNLNDPYLAERASDVRDLQNRLLRILTNERMQVRFSEPVIVFARNFTPSETAAMDTHFIQAFATESGGPASHTAIVAEALHIPAVVGVGQFLHHLASGDIVIVDGDAGTIIIHPDENTLERYERLQSRQQSYAVDLASLKDLKAVTKDGTEIELLGNIEFPSEAEDCWNINADGIGLYRTEFLYLGGEHPDEQEQYEAYRGVLEKMNGRPVTIRTVDLGADKLLEKPDTEGDEFSSYYIEEEKNPCLGLRSIRLSLKRVELFRRQLRAILRAAYYGRAKIMFPLISTVAEWRQARMIVEDVKEDLAERGVHFAPDVPIGMMVEVPSSVLMIDRFVREVDFFSIGTNDLTQYTLAVDRTNKDVYYLYNSCDPVILKLIHMTVLAADGAGKPVSLCGQMSGNPIFTPLLLGLGLRHLSMAPALLPEVKKVCREVDIEQCRLIAQKALEMEKASEVRNYLRAEYFHLFPEMDGEGVL